MPKFMHNDKTSKTQIVENLCSNDDHLINHFPNKHLYLCLWYKFVDNRSTVGKGDIAHNRQFLLFSQCFLPFFLRTCHLLQT